jgi:hypothetical protein
MRHRHYDVGYDRSGYEREGRFDRQRSLSGRKPWPWEEEELRAYPWYPEYYDRPRYGEMRGPKGWTRSDDRIRDEICERIVRCGIDAREVELEVNAGEVTLTGTVARRDLKRWIEDIADRVIGVREVHNRIRTRKAGEITSREVRRAAVAARAAPRQSGAGTRRLRRASDRPAPR